MAAVANNPVSNTRAAYEKVVIVTRKTELEELIQKMPRHVAEALSRVKWPHDDENARYLGFLGTVQHGGGQGAPGPMSGAVCSILGRVGHFLHVRGIEEQLMARGFLLAEV